MEPTSKRVKTEQSSCKIEILDELAEIITLADKTLNLENELSAKLSLLSFGDPVTHVYNPLLYASETHANYVRKYLKNTKKLIFLGMNPGPFGMVQTGVPFGDSSIVKNWLKIEGRIGQPESMHPKRPVLGFECKRSEVSGARFWGLVKDLCEVPENFFKNCYVLNYCPLAFLNRNGKNVTPADFKKAKFVELENICDEHLMKMLILLNSEIVVTLGKFTYDQCKKLMKKFPGQLDHIRFERILHPSPMNPATNINGGWKVLAFKELESLNLIDLISGKEYINL